jgi:tyrosyl-tRNA synthetase
MIRSNELLTRGVVEIIEEASLKSRLNSGQKLTVKLGIDPTNSQLHLGHYLVLQKLRDFQDRGHQAVLVIGDFTAMVGDPSGKSSKRVALTKKEIQENMRHYADQAGKIIDLKKAKIVYNSSWFNNLGIDGIAELASKVTFAQIMERKEFRQRLKRDDLSMLEFLYPLLQGYDSVMLKADVELGGLDQKLNLLIGRQIQKRYGQQEQDIVLTPLLVGLDGREKMSKTAGNYIAFSDSPNDMFGKVMSIPDSLMKDYFINCTRIPMESIETIFADLSRKRITPMQVKKKLSYEIVLIYHGKGAAKKAQTEFERVFQKRGLPEPEKISSKIGEMSALDFVVNLDMFASRSEARRLIEQGGLKINREKITQPDKKIKVRVGTIAQIGKLKAVKITAKKE